MVVLRKFKDRDECFEYLQGLTMSSLMSLAVDVVMELQTKSTNRIVITEEQFKAFFRIRGIKDDGERETRGRSRKYPELELDTE